MGTEGIQDKYINPYTDFGFNLLFGTAMNKELFEAAEIAKFNPKELGEYWESLKNFRDWYSVMSTQLKKADMGFVLIIPRNTLTAESSHTIFLICCLVIFILSFKLIYYGTLVGRTYLRGIACKRTFNIGFGFDFGNFFAIFDFLV